LKGYWVERKERSLVLGTERGDGEITYEGEKKNFPGKNGGGFSKDKGGLAIET